ncbi:Vacuolar protein sorting-associated protein 53 [Diatrype stigma]|uniref:Vacuolar protein sorting-associated protein 53 n=1 Tax=Diatrype stigma TaxID=117547 RepID=A0AAN9UI53_9PEZI
MQRTVEYDPIQHLNLLFSHPSTVTSISHVSTNLTSHHNELSAEIARLETAQAYGPDSSLERMQAAQAELAGLFRKIETVRSRAIETEQNITSMTADIKRLDGTKRNLTLSMTALKRLQMLTTAYEQLRGLARARQYRECAGLLQAVLQLMRHFNSYRSIDQIAALSRGVGDLQRELLEQVCEDFEIAFAKGEVAARRAVLVEACHVMDALGENAKARLVAWYVNTELREYRQVFRGNDEAGNLDNIGRRYAWFKRMMKTHEEQHAAIFPPHWRVGETLAMAFCDGTRDDYKGILEKSMRRVDNARIDVNLLLSCLQETMDFEQTLERRFASEPRASIDTLSSADERTQSFNGSISVAFEPYLSLWVESQDKTLAAMIPKYKSQPLIPPDEEFAPQAVISSAIELFHFYKLTLSQCAKLSTSERLLDLSKTLAKYLDEYAQQVLLAILQKSGPSGPSLHDIILVMNTADFWHTNTEQLEASIKKRIDPDLAARVDLSSQADTFLGVASAAIIALVGRVEAGCEGAWREMRNTNWSKMESVGDQSSYVGELLRHVNSQAEEIMAVVAKPQYARAFADKLIEHLATTYMANIVQCKPVSEVGAEQMLLDKYVLTKAFENLLSYHHSHSGQNINNAKPSAASSSAAGGASAPGSPSIGGNSSANNNNPPPPAGFVKRVNAAMTRIDPLLKTLQVRASPPEALVQAYLIHVADRSDTNFRRVLDLKGVSRRAEQAHLLELFAIHRDGPGNEGRLVAQNALLTPLLNHSAGLGGLGSIGSSSGNTGGGGGGIAGLGLGIAGLGIGSSAVTGQQGQGSGANASAATTRFDAATFGEKLLNAARDGVERIGTPAAAAATASAAQGGGGGAGGAGNGGEQAGGVGGGAGGQNASINDNLKKMGNFFRRDNFGLGARFGKRDGSADGR